MLSFFFYFLPQVGRYLCTVSNGIGQDLNQVVNLTVKGERQGSHIVSILNGEQEMNNNKKNSTKLCQFNFVK